MIKPNPMIDVDAYIDAVMGGDQVACGLVRAAVQRHTDDLERQGTVDFPYRFCPDTAARVLEYFPANLRHSIGRFANQPFMLRPWQQFGLASIFGWLRADNSRRFRQVYWSTSRKTGKSTLGAGLSIYLAADDLDPRTMEPEQVAQVILSATKQQQANEVILAEIKRMLATSPQFERKFKTRFDRCSFKANQGAVLSVCSTSGLSGMNASGVVFDELHEWDKKHQSFWETMHTGSVSRSQPLFLSLTTAGHDRCDLWKAHYEYACGVARGDITDEHFFTWCFEIDPEDDPLDEANWIKANPNLDISVPVEYVREAANTARQHATELNAFTRFYCNRMVTPVTVAFTPDAWKSCEGELSDWKEADAIGGGIDLGGRDDLAAFALCARFPVVGAYTEPLESDEEPRQVWRYELRCWSYIASNTSRDLKKLPFADWVASGALISARYPITELKAEVYGQCEKLYVSDIAYDPYNGQTIAEDFETEGIVVARMPQSYQLFNEPIDEMLQAVKDGRLRHNGDPVLSWAAGNAVLTEDRQQRKMYDKRSSTDKIDPIVACTQALFRAMHAPESVSGDLFVVAK